MLSSFEEFLGARKNKKNYSREAIIVMLPMWIEAISEDLIKLAKRGVISSITAEVCQRSLNSWREQPAKNLPQDLSLQFIQKIYGRMINFLFFNIEFNPHLLPIPGGYPFGGSVSGVEMAAHIIQIDLNEKAAYVQKSAARSLIGMSEREKDAVPKNFRAQLAKITWLKQRVSQQGKELEDILPPNPHAEHIWFLTHAQTLLDYCQTDNALKQLPKLNDLLPQTQLAEDIRLEIITSSSCCELCRYLFSALRLELEENGVYLPIILYADTAYNNTKEYLEPHGSIYILNSKGEFVNAELQCLTPKTKEQMDLPLKKIKLRHLSSKEQQDFACLARIGGLVIMDLIRVGISPTYEDTVNPFTYIAPDSIIIYVAEFLAKKPKAPTGLVKTANYLNQMLANIDKSILIYWRMRFTEQLHWLLISHRDQRYYEEARKNAQATDMNFSIELYGNDDSEYIRFYSKFSAIWSKLTDLTEMYERMFHFFVESSYMRMPLGAMVGPLSILMILDDHYFSKRDQFFLLKRRGVKEIEVPKSVSNDRMESIPKIKNLPQRVEKIEMAPLMKEIGFLGEPSQNATKLDISLCSDFEFVRGLSPKT